MRRQRGPLRTSAGVPVNVALRVHPEASNPVEKKRHCRQAAALRWPLASILANKRNVKPNINLEQSNEWLHVFSKRNQRMKIANVIAGPSYRMGLARCPTTRDFELLVT
jgi:hypothetical protein